MLLIPTISSLLVLASIYRYLDEAEENLLMFSTVSEQRLIAEQIGIYSHLLHQMGNQEAEVVLRNLRVSFDRTVQSIRNIPISDNTQGAEHFLNSMHELKGIVALWEETDQSLTSIMDKNQVLPTTNKAYEVISLNIPKLSNSLNRYIIILEANRVQERRQMLIFLTSTFIFNFLMLLTGFIVIKYYLEERNKSEKELEAEKDFNGKILNNVDEIIYRTSAHRDIDKPLKIQFVSQGIERILGYSADEFQIDKQLWLALIHPKDRNGVIRSTLRLISKGITHKREYRLMSKKTGQYRWFSDNPTAEFGSDGAIVGILGVARDINDIKKSEQRLIKAKNEAEIANKVKSEFLNNISHEIRTPLTSILGSIELVEYQLKHKIDHKIRKFFKLVRSSSNRLLITVEQIMDIAQIEAGGVVFLPNVVQLSALVGGMHHDFNQEAQERGLTFSFENLTDKSWVKIDRKMIQSAISKLVANAIKFTHEGGVNLILIESEEQLELIIKDSGIGIAEEYLKNLYTTFSQESVGFTKEYQGLGLGLAIAKCYLDFNGVITNVESAKNVGTTITLKFDFADEFELPVLNSKNPLTEIATRGRNLA